MKSLYEDLPPVEIAGRKFVGQVLFALLVLVSALVGATTGLLLVYTTDLPQVEALEMRAVVTNTIMRGLRERKALARVVVRELGVRA